MRRSRCNCIDCIFMCYFNNVDLFPDLLKFMHFLVSIELVLEAKLRFFLQGVHLLISREINVKSVEEVFIFFIILKLKMSLSFLADMYEKGNCIK